MSLVVWIHYYSSGTNFCGFRGYVNHEFKCSTNYKVSIGFAARDTKSNIQETASFPQSLKIDTHEHK